MSKVKQGVCPYCGSVSLKHSAEGPIVPYNENWDSPRCVIWAVLCLDCDEWHKEKYKLVLKKIIYGEKEKLMYPMI